MYACMYTTEKMENEVHHICLEHCSVLEVTRCTPNYIFQTACFSDVQCACLHNAHFYITKQGFLWIVTTPSQDILRSCLDFETQSQGRLNVQCALLHHKTMLFADRHNAKPRYSAFLLGLWDSVSRPSQSPMGTFTPQNKAFCGTLRLAPHSLRCV